MMTDKLPRILFGVSSAMLVFGAGVVAEHYNVFPLPWLKSSVVAVEDVLNKSGVQLPWYYTQTDADRAVPTLVADRVAPGLTLVAGAGPGDSSRVRVVDVHGTVVHEWKPDWFAIWPDASHVPEADLPKSRAALVHGALLMPDGDLVFNLSELALVRMDVCGEVEWKIPYRTHHSVAVDTSGNIWVPGLYKREVRGENDPPNHVPPFHDYTLMQVSPDGEVLQELRVFDLLRRNGLQGLLHMSSTFNRATTSTGDTMHLNDIEVFPLGLDAGVFSPGDVMISLRNINAVLVFDPSDWHVKFSTIGATIRQHDPDFVDGNTISVFDNNNLRGIENWDDETLVPEGEHYSRVVSITAPAGRVRTEYTGTTEHPLFTDIMGQHERLPNGDLLITESVSGRVIEVDRQGETVWEYLNLVGDGLKGLVSDAHRLPPQFNEEFFTARAAQCTVPPT